MHPICPLYLFLMNFLLLIQYFLAKLLLEGYLFFKHLLEIRVRLWVIVYLFVYLCIILYFKVIKTNFIIVWACRKVKVISRLLLYSCPKISIWCIRSAFLVKPVKLFTFFIFSANRRSHFPLSGNKKIILTDDTLHIVLVLLTIFANLWSLVLFFEGITSNRGILFFEKILKSRNFLFCLLI